MKLFNLSFFADAEARSAAENMALDEAIFLHTTYPVMRSFRWIRPAVSFGYFTPWRSVVERFGERDLVRRWTGGGIVEHGNDFTYSVIFPDQNLATNAELYRFIHSALAELLRGCGHPVEVLRYGDLPGSNDCFERAVQCDLKVRGKKIAGAALRRTNKGILLQGSIQRIELPEDFTAMFANVLSEQTEKFALSGPIIETAALIAREKYGAAEWTQRF
jgi:lipoyl(octanoyl) transferase